jgi:hypothetical protein
VINQQQSSEIHLRTPHMELPLFTGENPRAWLLECEDIFNLIKIPADARAQWGIAHIRGQAKTWLNTAGFHLQHISWSELGSVLLERFPDAITSDPMELLQQLKQTTTVDLYIDSYENWMTLMKRGRNYLPQDFFVDRFISGLKDTIKHHVHCQKPNSLLSAYWYAAYWYARQYEKAYLSANRKPIVPPVQRQGLLPPMRAQPARENRNRQFPDRAREPRKCWYCPDNWVVGHRCQPLQRALHAMEMQGHDLEDDQLQEQVPVQAGEILEHAQIITP